MNTIITTATIMATSWLAFVCFRVLSVTPPGATAPLVPRAEILGWLLVIVTLYLVLRLLFDMRYDFMNRLPID